MPMSLPEPPAITSSPSPPNETVVTCIAEEPVIASASVNGVVAAKTAQPWDGVIACGTDDDIITLESDREEEEVGEDSRISASETVPSANWIVSIPLKISTPLS